VDNLVNLDESQRPLLARFLRENNEDDYSWVASTTALFVEVTKSYDKHLGNEGTGCDMLQIIDSALGMLWTWGGGGANEIEKVQ